MPQLLFPHKRVLPVRTYSSVIDLFADATFLSATPKAEAGVNVQSQVNVDLFASEPASSDVAPLTVDFFVAFNKDVQPEAKATNAGVGDADTFDPFVICRRSAKQLQ